MTSVGRILPFLLLTLAALGAVIWFELGAQPHEQQRELPARVPTTIRQGVVAGDVFTNCSRGDRCLLPDRSYYHRNVRG